MDAGITTSLTPYFQDDLVTLYCGDVRDVLPKLPAETVQTCVTSPPYFGLRNYNVDGQIGLEQTPNEYIITMANIFRQVHRVLRKDGTFFMNMGDSYANDAKWGGKTGGKHANGLHGNTSIGRDRRETGLKPKDLIGMPWRLALTLQQMGWWLRQDIIWHKPNPMPESVRDRCTKAHEYIFHLSKSADYFYDIEAIKEPVAAATISRMSQPNLANQKGSDRVPGKTNGPMKAVVSRSGNIARKTGSQRGCPEGTGSNVCGSVPWEGSTRNRRSVWTVSTKPFKEAHFATFPPDLIEPCIKAGTSEKGQCSLCFKPFERVVDRQYVNPGNRSTNGPTSNERKYIEYGSAGYAQRLEAKTETLGCQPSGKGRDRTNGNRNGKGASTIDGQIPQKVTVGWDEQCCALGTIEPQIVLDPFAGAGTTLLVARKLGRRSIGIELNPEYCEMIVRRLKETK